MKNLLHDIPEAGDLFIIYPVDDRPAIEEQEQRKPKGAYEDYNTDKHINYHKKNHHIGGSVFLQVIFSDERGIHSHKKATDVT